ncbi:hypothetical protein BI313_11440 [Xanthomonas vesicatoria]|nr:hypothetical protein BI313_11440 [Xanthomonas vesicatoria]
MKGWDDVGILPSHRKARTITAGHGKDCCHRPGLRFPSMRTARPTQRQAQAHPCSPPSGVTEQAAGGSHPRRRATAAYFRRRAAPRAIAPAAQARSCSIARP